MLAGLRLLLKVNGDVSVEAIKIRDVGFQELGRFVDRQFRRELPVQDELRLQRIMVGTGRFELPNSPYAAALCRAPLASLTRESAIADSKIGALRGSAVPKRIAGAR